MSTAPDRKAKIAAAAPKERRLLPWIAALAVLALIAGGVIYALTANKSKSDDVKQAEKTVTAPPNANPAKDGIVVNPGKAKSGAPVVAVFQDYQCPACANLERSLGPTLDEMAQAGDIQLEYHTMTFLDGNVKNDASVRSAQAAACADTVGAYGKYHNTVYKNQPAHEGTGYTDEQLTKTFATEAGITGDKLTTFQSCYKDKRMASWVTATNDKAGRAGISSTPTLRVNGKDFDLKAGFKDVADFKAKLLAAGK